jgi:hypothetical protein
MPGQHGGKRAGAGRHPKEGAGSSPASSQGPEKFSAPSLTVPGISGRSGMISPFFTSSVGTPGSQTLGLPSVLSRSTTVPSAGPADDGQDGESNHML